MSHCRFALGFTRHRKVLSLSDAAFRLWVSAMDHSRDQGTNGELHAIDLDAIPRCPPAGPKRQKLIDELVRERLWDQVGAAWQIHDYLDWQDSREHIRTKREQARERMRRVRANKDENFAGTAGEVRDASSSSSSSSSDPPVSVGGAGGRDWPARLVERGRKLGDFPLPRHDPLQESIPISRWFPSKQHLDWARETGLSDERVDAAIVAARNKLKGAYTIEFWDDKVRRFLESEGQGPKLGPRRAGGTGQPNTGAVDPKEFMG